MESTSLFSNVIKLAVAAMCIVMVVACVGRREELPSQARPVAVSDDVWTRFDAKRIFFAHQSVGRDIIGGVEHMHGNGARPALRVHNLASGPPPAGPVLIHIEVGKNGEPASKLKHFRELLEGGLGGSVDVAMLKFCFWDIRRDTDVETLFAQYQSTFAALEKEFPTVQFVHATVPLTAADRDWRAGVRRIFGRPVPTTLDNQARHRFSSLIRGHYQGKQPIFDIEAAESDDDENGIPYLAAGLTYDGGHLNDAGQQRVAGQFITSIGNLAGTPIAGSQ